MLNAGECRVPKTSDGFFLRQAGVENPSEKFIEEKKQTFRSTREEANAKSKELLKTCAKRRDADFALENTAVSVVVLKKMS